MSESELENARLFSQAEQRRKELEALYRADAELYQHLRLDDVLQALVDIAADILQADKSSLMVWDDRRERLVVRVAHGFDPKTMAQMTFAMGEGSAGRVAMTGEPVIVEDTRADPHVATRITDPEGIRSFMHAPIKIGGQIFGVFNVDYGRTRAFSDGDLRLFEALAQRAALAIQTAQLHEQAQALAIAEERSRLARDLHDSVTQTLFSASLITEVLPQIWDRNPDEGQQRLDELRELTRGALAEMRTLLLELRPLALEEAALDELLRQLAESITGRARVPVFVHTGDAHPEDQDRLQPEVKVAFYRIAQEALNNVARHAGDCRADVTLLCQPGQVELRICDNGRGFNPDYIPSDHLGLGIMRERAATVGAKLAINSQTGSGTEVVVVWTDEARNGNLTPARYGAYETRRPANLDDQ
jgi:signal transduction histidine kinase